MVIKWILPGFFGVFIALGALSVQAYADELKVFPDEYIVTGQKASKRNSISVISQKGFAISKRLGKANLLKHNNLRVSTSTSRVAVPYDATNDACQELLKTGEVDSCSPNFEIKISATSNDPKLSQLWGFNATQGSDVLGAWDISKGSEEQVVAVIDTGIDYNHPDLSANVWVNPFEIAENGIDDDANGYIDDIHGISAVNASGDPLDDNNHGTHVSGTIGGKGNNGVGVAGINWNVKIMALKFLDAGGSGSLASAIECINYMVAMKNKGINIRVSNNSWGGGGFSQGLFDAIKAASDAGILFVAAAGNSSNDNDATPSYPAGYEIENIVSVAAIDSNQNLANFSNYGLYSVDIAAPGVNILSTTKSNQYATYSGTSMASPHVAGALALLLSSEPNLSNQDAIKRLYESATDSKTLKGLIYTGRKLSVARLLKNINVPFTPPQGNSTNCEYNINELEYAPDYSADSEPVVLQGDEYVFANVELPFSFPFYNENINQISLSPNGVIYFKGQPNSLDFKNTEIAPINSFAALHTDLYLVSNPLGIRVSKAADHVTIYWLAKQYKARTSGDVEVRTTLHSDGSITNFVKVEDSSVEKLLQSSSTIGIHAQSIATDYTYAYNNSLIHNLTAVKFSRYCTIPEDNEEEQGNSKLNEINGYTYNARGAAVKKIFPKRLLNLDFNGIGDGSYNLNVKLDNYTCPKAVGISIQNGYGYNLSLVPKSVGKYRSVKFSVGSINDSLSVKASPLQRSKNTRKTLAEKNRDCELLANRLQQGN